MLNPLNKRLFRELKADFGKYFVIFFVMVLAIAEGSGFLVAASSMLRAYDDGFVKYNIEDGNFRLEASMSDSLRRAIENNDKAPVKIYENFYIEDTIENGSKIRLYKNRKDIDRVSVLQGRLPKQDGEIAIDRMYADNNKFDIGSEIIFRKAKFKVVGLVALSDYSALFEDNGDVMFDATEFGVAVTTGGSFDAFNKKLRRYQYSYKYKNAPKSEKEEKDMGEDFLEALVDMVSIENFQPAYSNQAITYTGDDFGGDAVMMRVFIYIIIVILAFVFGIMINNTIRKEAMNVGTLRASGYSRNEVIIHYMLPPVFVTIVSAVVGNILGYTVFEKINAGMYYGSYSLPSYHMMFNLEAFLETTLLPIILMIVITYVSLRKKMKISPLNFLRNDLSKKGHKRAFYLSRKIPFIWRFKIRVIFQNISNYMVLIFGIFFAYFILMFGSVFPEVIDDFGDNVRKNMFAEYQYILQVPAEALGGDSKLKAMMALMEYSSEVETEVEGAEKFSAYMLKTTDPDVREEKVSFYGIDPKSKYINLKLTKDDFVISKAFSEKFRIGVGDKVKLAEEYDDDKYEFTVTGIYDYDGSICAFMDMKTMNSRFDLGDGYFSGYFSDKEINDIPEEFIGTVIDYKAMTKISRQMKVSMGGFMKIVQIASIGIFVVLVYILSKIIIERNASSISMAKILGYWNREVSNLYINATTAVALITIVIMVIVERGLLVEMFHIMLRTEMNGWFNIVIKNSLLVRLAVIGIVTYGVVAGIEYYKVKKIPLDEALKNGE
ncbi:MAG: ABC transporter permease [Eubacterium sp.]|nr:ABC transporter permease [Eubacterium sp.]